jgi:membrane protease YdiL (CAAX protease family)
MPDAPPPTEIPPAPSGFWNRLPRYAFVRILIGLGMVIVITAILQIAFQFAGRAPNAKRFLNLTYLPAFVGMAATVLVYRGFVRWIEKRPVTELGTKGAALETTGGVLLGAAMFGATVGILALLGCFRVLGLDSWEALPTALVASAVSAVVEEIIFRGIIFRITEESLGTWIALVISALLFGAVHMLNPNASLQGGIAIVLEAGIFLAAAFLTTRRLWFVMGAHFGWNFTEGGIFGAAVSGNTTHGLFAGAANGPAYLSGGIFGVEASVVAIAVSVVVSIFLLRKAKAEGKFVTPFWRRR